VETSFQRGDIMNEASHACINIFEECWNSVLRDYGPKRLLNVYCSEADIQQHFASKLLEKMRLPTCVYVEFPIIFDIDKFILDRMNLGKPMRKMKKGEGIVADIVIMDAHELVPSIIAELKYLPLIWNYLPILKAVEEKATKAQKEKVKKQLQIVISRLKTWEAYGPSQSMLLNYSKSMEKIIQLVKGFEEKYNESVNAYFCVIDEFYPNLGQLLDEEVKKYVPPDEFKLRFHHNSVKSWLEEQLSKL
jgi:hypothetical protein